MLQKRYSLESLPHSELELLEAIGRKRGCLRAGGHVDLNKVCTLFLNDLRTGSIGKLSLETPAIISHELQELELKKAQRLARQAEKKQARKKKRKR